MQNVTKYIGLDVSKEKIAVAIASEGREEARNYGTIPHTKDAVRKLVNQVSGDGIELDVCYEAGPTGFVLYHWLLEMGVRCTVAAPSLIPKRPGERVKTDRRDARRLAALHRSGELTPVYVPTPEDESFRDLIRAREDAKEDLNRHKQRLGKFLLRQQLHAPQAKPGSKAYEAWLDTLRFENKCHALTFQEYRHSIQEAKQRIARYEKEIAIQSQEGPLAAMIQALQALRGIALLTAATIASELGTIARFPHPRYLMSYSGLVPGESSSGTTRRQGAITKAGNTHLRRVLVEAAWSYRHVPGVRQTMRKRLEGLPPEIQSISWEAQNRLHTKYKKLSCRGKHKGTITTAVARELLGFIWAVAKEVEKRKEKAAA